MRCLSLILVILCPVIAKGQSTKYKYDRQSRLMQVAYPNKLVKSFAYDKDGNRTAETDTICKQPTAAFSASQTAGPCPLTVNFSDSSNISGASYYWQFILDSTGTAITSTSQNPSGITYTKAGSYPVFMKITNPCGVDSLTKPSYIIITCFPTRVQMPDTVQSLTVYPNPAADVVNVSGVHMLNGTYYIQLKTITGQLLLERMISVQDSTLNKQFGIRQYPGGLYYVHIVSSNNSWTFKLSKTN